MDEFWRSLTEGQGTVIASIVTLVAAVVGVVLGWKLFSGRVKDLETALAASESKLQEHIALVDRTLTDFGEKADEQLASVLGQLNRLGGAIEERLAQTAALPGTKEQPAMHSVRENWDLIRSKLETVASSKDIDGRTRAKYGRIDRRNYGNLVAALDGDGRLGSDGNLYNAAVGLWHQYRPGRVSPTIEDAARMHELAARLTGAAAL